MLIRKRTGQEVDFDKSKIQTALTLANNRLTKDSDKLDNETILSIVNTVTQKVQQFNDIPTVEDIQDLIQKEICKYGKDKLFEEFTVYRYRHSQNREKQTFNARIRSICNNDNEEVFGDNANKDPKRLNTQRDYIAGTVSKDIYLNEIVSEEIKKAHNEGILHQHDADYSVQKMHNCDLADLLDILWNGTVISDVLIERPKSFSTACTIATQAIGQIASSQYGGQTVSLAHLVPFVDISRQKLRKDIIEEGKVNNVVYTDEQVDNIAEMRLAKEIKKGIQTIQYQILTILSSNGQTPFITLAMFRNDIDDVADFCQLTNKEQLHKDFNTLVEEVLKQRIQGVKADDGADITPSFPKLIYCVDSTCCDESTPNWYLTELAAECSSKRMVPDYVSEKEMIELRGIKPYNQLLLEKYGIDYLGNIQDNDKFTNATKDIDTTKENIVQAILDKEDLPYEDAAFSSMGCLDYSETIELKGLGNLKIGQFIDCIDELYKNKAVINQFFTECKLSPSIETARIKFNDYYITIDTNGKYTVCTETVKLFESLDFNAITLEENPKSTCYNLEQLDIQIKSGTEWVKLTNVVYNVNVTAWKKIKYNAEDKVDVAADFPQASTGPIIRKYIYTGTILATLDHPFKVEGNKEVQCNDLQVGQCLLDTNLEPTNQIIEIIPVYIEAGARSYDVTTASSHFNVNNRVYSHNCRSQLSVWRLKDHPEFIAQPKQVDERGYVKAINNKWYNPNKMIKYSRFNIGVTTLNLPDIALSAYQTKEDLEEGIATNYEKFWKLFDERLELCHKAIRLRYDYLLGTKAEVAPILWQYGVLARLKAKDTIDDLMKNGFCTASLGYVGLYETVKWLTGKSHTQDAGRDLGMQIMTKLRQACDTWKASEPEHIGYALYGTPEEQTTEKFARALQRRHGIIEGITDKLYVTNSYHIPVFEEIDAFSKLSKEAPFQELSSGGNITYVEVPAMTRNIPAMLAIIKHIYHTNIYAEINTKLDYCKKCKYEGEILLTDDIEPKKYRWKCPNCGNTDVNYMYIVRRICGYLASMSTGSNQGRLGDIHDRVTHL